MATERQSTEARLLARQRGNRISAEGEPAHCCKVEIGINFTHYLAHKRCRHGIEGDPAQVDVVIGLATTRQNHFAAHHGFGKDLFTQGIPGISRHRHTLR